MTQTEYTESHPEELEPEMPSLHPYIEPEKEGEK